MSQDVRDRIAAAGVYADLTATAEKTIRRLMNQDNRPCAFGAWLLWHEMTVGYQNDGDSDRLAWIFEKTEAA